MIPFVFLALSFSIVILFLYLRAFRREKRLPAPPRVPSFPPDHRDLAGLGPKIFDKEPDTVRSGPQAKPAVVPHARKPPVTSHPRPAPSHRPQPEDTFPTFYRDSGFLDYSSLDIPIIVEAEQTVPSFESGGGDFGGAGASDSFDSGSSGGSSD